MNQRIQQFDEEDLFCTFQPVIQEESNHEIIVGTEIENVDISYNEDSTSYVDIDEKQSNSSPIIGKKKQIEKIHKKITKTKVNETPSPSSPRETGNLTRSNIRLKLNETQPPNYPGETKNIPKNFSRALKASIRLNYTAEVQQVHEVRILMKAENDKAGRDTLTKFINGSVGKQIANEYFGNYNWALQFITENKVSVDQFFKFNTEWYSKTF